MFLKIKLEYYIYHAISIKHIDWCETISIEKYVFQGVSVENIKVFPNISFHLSSNQDSYCLISIIPVGADLGSFKRGSMSEC